MKKIFSVLMAVCGCVAAEAQISSAEVQLYTVANNDPYAATDSMGIPLPYHVAALEVNFSSLADVVRLHVKLGSSAGASDIFNSLFELNAPGMFEDGVSMGIDGNTVHLILGGFIHQGTFYSEVKAELSDGSFTEVYGDESP